MYTKSQENNSEISWGRGMGCSLLEEPNEARKQYCSVQTRLKKGVRLGNRERMTPRKYQKLERQKDRITENMVQCTRKRQKNL